MIDYYALPVSEAIKKLQGSSSGLSKAEAEKRLHIYGYNELKKERRITPLAIFLNQFKNALILLLIIAGILSLLLGNHLESLAIFAIILLNALLGFVQEYRGERAMTALEKNAAPTARVLREGIEEKIPAREVVPGDILLFEAGDIVAADTRIIEAFSLEVDESVLTGESSPSEKSTKPFTPGTSVGDQENMAFMGTIVTYGRGKGIVSATDMNTEFGKIATSLQTTKDTQTPLQVKFAQLARQLGAIAVALVLIVLITGTLKGSLSPSQMILFALTLTVSTVPNSLPIIVTVSLSMGARRLAKKNMLIRKLSAAESLGAVTVICTDKTGTITENQMTITTIYHEHETLHVSGAGYEPRGSFFLNNKQIIPKKLELLLRTGYLCNNSKLKSSNGKFEIIGDPTEGSLIVLGKKGGIDEEDLHRHFEFVEELPFDSDRKKMSVISKNRLTGKKEAYVKGAPDLLLKRCDRILDRGKIRRMSPRDRKKILSANNTFAENAMRVLALAYRPLPKLRKHTIKNVETRLIFVGLVGMIDPPRDEVKRSIAQCQEAGINVIMITGDHPITAKAVAQQIGLFNIGDEILTGEDLTEMTDDELQARIHRIRIIARAMPIQKSRIVDALQKKGHIVAMTGDGVNDAPALKKADIGISTGITGTDVAKEVSKATLVDDNFATIVAAIDEGRNIYDKIIKSARYLLSCNSGEIITVFLAILFNLPLPLLPLQILLMSTLTDDFPALGLGVEKSEEGIMKRSPRDPKEKPISKSSFSSIMLFGLIMGLGTLYIFKHYLETAPGKAQTVAFTTLVLFQMFAVISSRTLRPGIKHLNPFSNKTLAGAVCLSIAIQIAVIYLAPLQTVFSTIALSSLDWFRILALATLGLITMELSKFFINLPTNNSHQPPARDPSKHPLSAKPFKRSKPF